MLQLLLTVSAGLAGYLMARSFVRNRLRFVDAIHSGWAPPVAGVVAFALLWPLSCSVSAPVSAPRPAPGS